MSDNSWYEKGELPPVGEKVIFKYVSQSKKHLPEIEVIILAHVVAPNGQHCAVYCSENCNNDPASGIACYLCFRPIKTERELAIDDMIKIAYTPEVINNRTIMGALYDAGYRKNES